MKLVRIGKSDNVAVAPYGIRKGETGCCGGENIVALCDIPAAHKIAVRNIKNASAVFKYGYKIGVATCDIKAGEWVHSHNMRSDLTVENNVCAEKKEHVCDAFSASFYGYRRTHGAVGVRNDIIIVPTVVCAVSIAEKIAKAFDYPDFSGEVVVASHPYGCSQLGADAEHTAKILGGIARNPNFGAALIVSLGCENNNLKVMEPYLRELPKERTAYITLQDVSDEVGEGVESLKKLAEIVCRDKRSVCDISELCLGVKCGGSDGLSGITANPLVGRVSDGIAGAGGSVIMSEIPETFGAEQILAARCDGEIQKTLDGAISEFKHYYTSHSEPIGENPSPGNKAGGITTNEEKSLGCVLKSGHTRITDVIAYGERVVKKGVTVLQAPGNDAVSLSALAAVGASVALFTTGRGTPLGSLIPVIKISTNSELAQNKPHWIDFDASKVLDSGFEKAGKELFETLLGVANGKKTCSENNGNREFAIWKNGVTL